MITRRSIIGLAAALGGATAAKAGHPDPFPRDWAPRELPAGTIRAFEVLEPAEGWEFIARHAGPINTLTVWRKL